MVHDLFRSLVCFRQIHKTHWGLNQTPESDWARPKISPLRQDQVCRIESALHRQEHIWDLKSTIFNQEQLIERNRKYHNGTLLQLGKAKHVIDLMKIMLIGAEKQDFVIYPSSDKTPNYLDLIANKIAEYEK